MIEVVDFIAEKTRSHLEQHLDIAQLSKDWTENEMVIYDHLADYKDTVKAETSEVPINFRYNDVYCVLEHAWEVL